MTSIFQQFDKVRIWIRRGKPQNTTYGWRNAPQVFKV